MLALAESIGALCRPLPLDFSTFEGVSELISLIYTESSGIVFLVNRVRFGRFGETSDMDLTEIKDMVSFNCTALAYVTLARIPLMPRGSHTIEVSSASIYLLFNELNVYASIKAFMRSFCNGFRKKLSDSGTSVLEVSPG